MNEAVPTGWWTLYAFHCMEMEMHEWEWYYTTLPVCWTLKCIKRPLIHHKSKPLAISAHSSLDFSKRHWVKHLLTCMGSRLLLLVPLFLHKPCTDADLSPTREKRNSFTDPGKNPYPQQIGSLSPLFLNPGLRFSRKYQTSTTACRPSGARECREGCSASSLSRWKRSHWVLRTVLFLRVSKGTLKHAPPYNGSAPASNIAERERSG